MARNFNLYRLMEGYEGALEEVRAFLKQCPKCAHCGKTATRYYRCYEIAFHYCDADSHPMSSQCQEFPYANLVRWLAKQASVSETDMSPQEVYVEAPRRDTRRRSHR